MKTLRSKEMVDEAVSEIERMAPKNSHVEIDVKEEPVGHFSTLIKLKAWNKTYIVKKEDMFFTKVLNKAVKALKAKLQKKKVSHDTIRSSKYYPA